jgi:hypothetical protein
VLTACLRERSADDTEIFAATELTFGFVELFIPTCNVCSCLFPF